MGMPEIPISGGRISYGVQGDASNPPLLLAHALGTTRGLWHLQLPTLARHFRLVTYDTRGHGASSAPPGDYTVEQLGRDALAVMDAVGADHAVVCGLSLGGLTAIWLAQHAPERVDAMILANTAARIGTPQFWQDRIDLIRRDGLGPVAETGPERWFTEPFRRTHPDEVARCRKMLLACSPGGYAACAAALRDADLRPALRAIATPALVIAGRVDPVTTTADAGVLARGIAGAQAIELAASHFSNVEQADQFTNAVVAFVRDKVPKKD
jgi:3-oxoadipate enol-lactonase